MYKIAIAGVGVVGGALLQIIKDTKKEFHNVTGQEIQVCGYLARSDKNLGVPFFSDYKSLINESNPDLLVELVGGVEGLAYDMTKYAIESGVSIVTANKALIAECGNELLLLANKHNVNVNYEAAVAGAIPIIRMLNNVLNFEQVTEVRAILNGTCNYILTKMSLEASSYNNALDEAKKLGYAEADPTLDVDGTDTIQKLKIISALVTGGRITNDEIFYKGIEDLSVIDINYASQNGLVLKLIAIASYSGDKVNLNVSPVFLRSSDLLSQVNQNYNVVNVKSKYAKDTTLIGYGAGGSETASAVYADIQNALILNSSKTNSEVDFSYDELLRCNTKYYIRYGSDFDVVSTFINAKDILTHDIDLGYLVVQVANSDFIKEMRERLPNIVYLAIAN